MKYTAQLGFKPRSNSHLLIYTLHNSILWIMGDGYKHYTY